MKKKITDFLLPILIIIEPFLNIYELYYNPLFEIAGFKITTIIRYLIILILGVIILFKTKLKPKRKTLIAYFSLIIVYLIFHHLNALNFHSLIPGNFNYSLKEELFYLTRYLIPLFLIYYIYYQEFDETTFKKTIVTYSLLISLSAIFTNIFYLARSSYSNNRITYNIFDWFTKDISHLNAASKGLFYSPSVINSLIIITPYLYYLYYKENKKYLIVIICNMLSLFMVGTKASTLGFIIIALLMPIGYLITNFKAKIPNSKPKLVMSATIILISGVIAFNSPALSRIYLENKYNTEQEELDETLEEEDLKISLAEISELKDETKKKDLTIRYIKAKYANLGLLEPLLKNYNYKYDWEFWLNVLVKYNAYQKSNNRYMEQKVLDRVKAINNNFNDNLLGLTYSRTTKIFNLERDYLYQYYSLGILGLLLFVLPLLTLYIINVLKVLFKKFTLENLSLSLGLGLIFCIALYSGDILDNITMVIIIGFTLGYFTKKVHEPSQEKPKKRLK